MKSIKKIFLSVFVLIFMFAMVGCESEVKLPVEEPEFSVSGGEISSGTEVTISCQTEDATIYYTTDGTEPDETSEEYTGPISITKNETIKAIAIKDGMQPSDVVSANYTIKVVGTSEEGDGTVAGDGDKSTKIDDGSALEEGKSDGDGDDTASGDGGVVEGDKSTKIDDGSASGEGKSDGDGDDTASEDKTTGGVDKIAGGDKTGGNDTASGDGGAGEGSTGDVTDGGDKTGGDDTASGDKSAGGGDKATSDGDKTALVDGDGTAGDGGKTAGDGDKTAGDGDDTTSGDGGAGEDSTGNVTDDGDKAAGGDDTASGDKTTGDEDKTSGDGDSDESSKIYTISFDSNGHGTAPEAITGKHKGDVITLPEAITADGWNFYRWNDGTKDYRVGEEYTVTADATFTVKWKVSIEKIDHIYIVKSSLPEKTDYSVNDSFDGSQVVVKAVLKESQEELDISEFCIIQDNLPAVGGLLGGTNLTLTVTAIYEEYVTETESETIKATETMTINKAGSGSPQGPGDFEKPSGPVLSGPSLSV